MKNKLKSILKFLGTFVLCFIAIYLVVFSGGWKLFESGDPILIEIGAALILSIFIFPIIETMDKVLTKQENKIKALEERISELENKQ